MKLIHRERERENLGGARRRRRRRRGRGRFQGLVGSPAIRHRIHHHSLHLCQSQPLFFFFAGIFILFSIYFSDLIQPFIFLSFFLGKQTRSGEEKRTEEKDQKGNQNSPSSYLGEYLSLSILLNISVPLALGKQ